MGDKVINLDEIYSLMVEQAMVTITVAIIGAITGSVSLGVLIYKEIWKERPILKFELKDAYFLLYSNPENPMTSFSISLNVHNRGKRSTTIHTTALSFNHEQKTYQPQPQGFGYNTVIITPDNTVHLLLNFFLPQINQFNNEIKDAELTITHTHGEKTIHVPKIRYLKQ